MKQHVRRLISLTAAAGFLTTLSAYVGPVAPADAASTMIRISGNFFGDARHEILEYQPGSAGDQFRYNFTIGLDGRPESLTKSDSISITYKPIAGDFDGDGYDEIFWYSPNTNADWFWDFDPAQIADYDLVPAPSVNASDWVMTVGDYSDDGTEDIFFYRPGSGTETIWDFPTDALTPTNVNSPHQVGGTYIPFGGAFAGDAADDIMWYEPSTGKVNRWDFEPGGFTTSSTALFATGPANAAPVSLDRRHDGGTDLFLYVAGATADPYWDFDAAGNRMTPVENMSVGQTYTTTSGNYFGDNGDDIYWTGSQFVFWNHYTDATGLHNQVMIENASLAADGESGADLRTTYTVQSDTVIDPNVP